MIPSGVRSNTSRTAASIASSGTTPVWNVSIITETGWATPIAQVAYAIGGAQPGSVMIDTFHTGVVPDEAIEAAVREVFDLTPLGIIKALDLRQPIYRATAAYGHFGRAPERRRFVDKDVDKEVELFTWEHANRVEDLRLAVQRSKHYQAKQVTA